MYNDPFKSCEPIFRADVTGKRKGHRYCATVQCFRSGRTYEQVEQDGVAIHYGWFPTFQLALNQYTCAKDIQNALDKYCQTLHEGISKNPDFAAPNFDEN